MCDLQADLFVESTCSSGCPFAISSSACCPVSLFKVLGVCMLAGMSVCLYRIYSSNSRHKHATILSAAGHSSTALRQTCFQRCRRRRRCAGVSGAGCLTAACRAAMRSADARKRENDAF
eukprot:3630993-Pleurochrysis_carterae.AAC.3